MSTHSALSASTYPMMPAAAAAAAAIERAVQFAGDGERYDLSVPLNSERRALRDRSSGSSGCCGRRRSSGSL